MINIYNLSFEIFSFILNLIHFIQVIVNGAAKIVHYNLVFSINVHKESDAKICTVKYFKL
jgi:hypothetical protein